MGRIVRGNRRNRVVLAFLSIIKLTMKKIITSAVFHWAITDHINGGQREFPFGLFASDLEMAVKNAIDNALASDSNPHKPNIIFTPGDFVVARAKSPNSGEPVWAIHLQFSALNLDENGLVFDPSGRTILWLKGHHYEIRKAATSVEPTLFTYSINHSIFEQ